MLAWKGIRSVAEHHAAVSDAAFSLGNTSPTSSILILITICQCCNGPSQLGGHQLDADCKATRNLHGE